MKRMPVAQLKRDFRSVLEAAERGEKTMVLRHGKPVAVVGPVSRPEEANALPKPRCPGGLLALTGSLSDWETLEGDMAEIIAGRRKARDRPPPDFD